MAVSSLVLNSSAAPPLPSSVKQPTNHSTDDGRTGGSQSSTFLLQANSSQSSSTSSTSSSNHGKLNMLHCIAIFIQSIRPPSCATANTMSSVHPSILRRSPFIPSWPPEGRGQIQRFYRSLELLESTTSSSSRCHHYSLCCCQLIVLNNIHLL